MTTPVQKDKGAFKPQVAKRALIQLAVSGFDNEKSFPSAANLAGAFQARAKALGYETIGEVTIDAASTDTRKIVNIVATDIEPVVLIGILDDVLKTFMTNGYKIELYHVTGTVATEMKLVRMTKRQFKAAKQAAATKAATVVTKAAVATSKRKVMPLLGRRSNACRKIARQFALRSVDTSGAQMVPEGIEGLRRVYAASGSAGVTPDVEAFQIARFLFAAYGINAVANGAEVSVAVEANTDIPALDSVVGNVEVVKVPGAKTDANAIVLQEWLKSHSAVYLDSNYPDAFYLTSTKGQITDLPKLA